jgi:hypothetical protein
MATFAFFRETGGCIVGGTKIIWPSTRPSSFLLARTHPAQPSVPRSRPVSRVSSYAPALLTDQPALVSNIVSQDLARHHISVLKYQPCLSRSLVPSPITSKPASPGGIKTGHSEVLDSYQAT